MKVCGPSIYKPLEIIFNQCLETGVFHLNGKKVTSFLFIKKGANRCCKTIVQCRCYLYVGKFLKDQCLMKCSSFFFENKLISSRPSGFKPGNSLSINCYLLFMRYIVLLMKALYIVLLMNFSISQRHLIKFGMMV